MSNRYVPVRGAIICTPRNARSPSESCGIVNICRRYAVFAVFASNRSNGHDVDTAATRRRDCAFAQIKCAGKPCVSSRKCTSYAASRASSSSSCCASIYTRVRPLRSTTTMTTIDADRRGGARKIVACDIDGKRLHRRAGPCCATSGREATFRFTSVFLIAAPAATFLRLENGGSFCDLREARRSILRSYELTTPRGLFKCRVTKLLSRVRVSYSYNESKVAREIAIFSRTK